jgi:hypothetical protein
VKLFGASISRCSELMIPLVIVPSRPKGLPIATTGAPTTSVDESATVSGWSCAAGASILITARSVDGSVPTTVAG